MLDFRLAVIGPTAVHGSGLGIAEGCQACARSNPATARQCQGFGAGCLGARETHSESTPARKR